MHMKNKLLAILFFIVSSLVYGQTNISGGLFKNTTWNTAGSPYIVTSDVALFPGYKLTIEPGVTIKFNSGTKLIVRGTLVATASSENKIVFTSNDNNPKKGSWKGIEVENNQGGNIIASHIKGEYADRFIRIMNSSNKEVLNIKNSEIKHCDYAFYGYDGHSDHTVVLDNLNVNNNNYAYIYAQNVTLTNSVFSDGEKGIHCWENIPRMYISDSEFSNFSIWPFNMGGEIDNCHIHHNAVGIRMKPNLIVKNSTIEANTIGIEANYPNPISGQNIFNNKICNSTQYNFKHLYSYSINIPNNCWCSNDKNEISKTIFDAYDDVSLGIVTFTPFKNVCSNSLSTPTFSDTVDLLKLYPNPAKGKITFSENINGNYKIYSMNGALVKQGIITKKLDVSQLSKGVYLIKLYRQSNEFSIKRFIKN